MDKQFSTLLREGPNFGIHTLIWCDNFTNLNRWLDRQVLHDLAMRVLFQMSAGDSANLMDTPEASRLGIHRAILYNEEQGEFEKFRPYGLPDDAWLRWVRDQLQVRFGANLGPLANPSGLHFFQFAAASVGASRAKQHRTSFPAARRHSVRGTETGASWEFLTTNLTLGLRHGSFILRYWVTFRRLKTSLTSCRYHFLSYIPRFQGLPLWSDSNKKDGSASHWWNY